MDITIKTADPSEINEDEIREAIEARGYFVASITIEEHESGWA